MRTLRSACLALVVAVFALAPAAVPAQTATAAITRDVVYGHKDGMALVYDVFRPANANGTAAIYMVSGGWVSRWQAPETRLSGFEPLLARGVTVFAVHHGSSPRFKVPDAVADVRRAVRHIRLNAPSHGVNPDRMGVFGGSAGGHLSLMLGLAGDDGDPQASDPVLRASSRVKTVVAYYPPTDLRRMTGPSERFPALDFDNALAAGISPILHVDPNDPPVLVIHGDADTLVPISSGRAIHEALTAAGVRNSFIVIEGGDHGFTNAEHRRRADEARLAWFIDNL